MKTPLNAALLSLLMATSAMAQHHPLMLPQNIHWSLATTINGKPTNLVFPKDKAKMAALPQDERNVLLDQIRRIERNQDVTRKVGGTFFKHGGSAGHRLTPDYERTLTEVAISLSYADAGTQDPLYRHLPILNALPKYSVIHIIGPTITEPALQASLAGAKLTDRVRTHPASAWNNGKLQKTPQTRPTRWVRDMFLVASTDQNQSAIFLPLAYGDATDLKNSDLNHVRERWHKEHLVSSIPLFIRGGNVAVADNKAGQRKAFVGGNEAVHNEALYRFSMAVSPPQGIVQEIVQKMALSDTVSVTKNSTKLFHLDMAFSFLAPGLAAVLTPVDSPAVSAEDLHVLEDVRKKLSANGFTLIHIPTTAARINAFQSSVNILPFTDKQSHKKRAIVPLFPDSSVTIDGRRQSLNEAIESAYENAGIEVIWAEDRFSDRNGNVHCTIIGLH